MPKAAVPQETVEAIYSAPAAEAHEALAARLGVGVSTVRKYRRHAREIREEAAQHVVAEHAERHVGDALEDLGRVRSLAVERYVSGGIAGEASYRHGQVAVQALSLELRLAGARPQVSEFEDLTDEELDALARGDSPVRPAGAGPAQPGAAQPGAAGTGA